MSRKNKPLKETHPEICHMIYTKSYEELKYIINTKSAKSHFICTWKTNKAQGYPYNELHRQSIYSKVRALNNLTDLNG